MHIILNENESCQLKLTNPVNEIVDQSEISCQNSKNSLICLRKVLTVFCFEDVRCYFNQGKLLTRKTSNETEHLMEFPIFKLPNHQRVFNNLTVMCTSLHCNWFLSVLKKVFPGNYILLPVAHNSWESGSIWWTDTDPAKELEGSASQRN